MKGRAGKASPQVTFQWGQRGAVGAMQILGGEQPARGQWGTEWREVGQGGREQVAEAREVLWAEPRPWSGLGGWGGLL